MSILSSPNNLLSKEELLLRLEEAEETLRAIRNGEVDALVISGAQGDQVFTLKDATLPYQILIEEMNEGALTLTPEGVILYCNARFAEILGVPLQTIIGKSFLHFVIPEDLARIRELLEQSLAGKSRGELTLKGHPVEIPVGISLTEILLDGEVRLGTVISDLTERKQAEMELRRYQDHLEELVNQRTRDLNASHETLRQSEEQLARSNQKLNEILVSIQDDFYVLDRDWKFVYASKLFTAKIGKEPEDFIGSNIWQMFPKHLGTVLEENFRAAMEQREIRRFEIGGKYTNAWYRMTAFPSAEGITVIGTDITERRRTERALRLSEEHFRLALAHAPVSVATQDRDLRYTWAYNQRTRRADEIVGKTDLDLFPSEVSHLTDLKHQVLETGADISEQLWVTSNDRRLFLDLYIEPLRNEIGEVEGVSLATVDLTRVKLAEEALQQSEAMLRTVLDQMPSGVTVREAHTGTLILSNVRSQEILGKLVDTADQFEQYRGFHADGHPYKSEEWPVFRSMATGEVVQAEEIECERRDGTHFTLSTNSAPIRNMQGQIIAGVAVFEDITVRKQAEAALLEAALQKQTFQYTRTLIEVSLDPLVTISPEGKITDVNEATVRATGVPRIELVGTDFSMYFTEPEVAERGYRQVFAQGFVTDYPLTVRHRDGHLMDVLYNASLYKDANGNVLGVFAAARDVTVQKRAEAELRHHKENLELLVKERTADLEESNRELARSNENLEQFAYVASHDLQEPLRIMSSYSQLLERRYKDKLDQDANDFIEFIVDAAARMQKLITDLLAYSRAGRETSNTIEVDCNEVLRKLVTGMARTIEEAHGRVTFEKLPTITVHESSLIQLFQNLIGNALKFRGEQPPCIHVSARRVEAEWVFSVRDNGIGIEPQYSQRIFMIFQRLHPRDKYPGTGIGLSICKKIVENLGGRIWVESEPGQGSTFYFTVPSEKSSR